LVLLLFETRVLAGWSYGSGAYGSGWYGYGAAAVLTSHSQIILPEGTSAALNLRLNTRPPSSQTVTVWRESGDSDITVNEPAQLEFTPDNWDQFQSVTLAAGPDEDSVNGQALLRCTAPGVTGADVTVTESDRTGPDDVDADGWSNYEEYVAGTDWLESRSFLLLGIKRAEAGMVLTFEAMATTPDYGGQVRHYRLASKADLAGGEWEPLPGAEDIVASGPVAHVTAASGERRFYRLQVWLTPPP
jgi:hypothetical protein